MGDYYELLGLKRSSSAEEVRSAFKALAKKHHPDRGGDPEVFKRLSEAAAVLQDPERRAQYDRKPARGESSSLPPLRRNRLVVRVSTSLEEVFAGAKKEVKFMWDKGCGECWLTGRKDRRNPSICKGCKGQGVLLRVRPVGPGIVQQHPFPCPSCQGAGFSIEPVDRCPKCLGNRLVPTPEAVSVRVYPGSQNESRLYPVSEGMSLLFEDHVVFLLDLQSHPLFERRGDHLVHKRAVPLVQALTGISFELTGVDGKKFQLQTSTNHITKPHSVFRLRNHGLPNSQAGMTTGKRGDLLVQLDVEFPHALSTQVQQILKRCLPPNTSGSSALTAAKTEISKLEPSSAAPSAETLEPIDADEAERLAHGGAHHKSSNQHECRQM